MMIWSKELKEKLRTKIDKMLEGRKRMNWFQDYGLMILVILMVGIALIMYNK
jgi:uncharacterized membrane protein|tara:strand:+ start:1323 stop:1478 length:156 start_codon:yes stop_codon:yes gene_type:complete